VREPIARRLVADHTAPAASRSGISHSELMVVTCRRVRGCARHSGFQRGLNVGEVAGEVIQNEWSNAPSPDRSQCQPPGTRARHRQHVPRSPAQPFGTKSSQGLAPASDPQEIAGPQPHSAHGASGIWWRNAAKAAHEIPAAIDAVFDHGRSPGRMFAQGELGEGSTWRAVPAVSRGAAGNSRLERSARPQASGFWSLPAL